MKNLRNQLAALSGRLNRRHLQIVLVLLYLALFVLGAGAPGATGDIGM
jgi:hypothetical protein